MTWLVILLLYYAMMTALNLLGLAFGGWLASKAGPTEPAWVTFSTIGLSGLSLVLTLIVFARKRWAFWGLIVA
ncbi:MAG: hypothetical protein ACRETL_12155, partial [Gammaproteobacteria bacterium]